MTTAKKTRSMRHKLWIYFGSFAALIMVVLWLLEIMFLNTFYKQMKVRQMEKIGNTLIDAYGEDDFRSTVEEVSFKNGISVLLMDAEGDFIIAPGFMHNGDHDTGADARGTRSRQMLDIIRKTLEQSKDGAAAFVPDMEFMRMPVAVFVAELTDEAGQPVYLYVNSPLAPVDATTQVLQSQLMIVTVISLLFSFALAWVMAQKLARPISRITASARELARGNYDAEFARGGYSEIDQLADVLNHTAGELSKTERLRRDLMANVSHDLRTPLTIIKSYAEMIRDISGDNKERREAHTGVIIEETDRLSLLVSDILDLSRMESGTTTLEKRRFDLSVSVESIVNRFRAPIDGEQFIFETVYEGNTVVEADERRIEQAVYNLLINAVNYTGEDRKITVRVRECAGGVRFSVTDTGTGIAPEELELVWDRYYKASSTHRRAGKGTGIGLSIVKNVLTLHNARYGVESTVGEGSTFWFTLPN